MPKLLAIASTLTALAVLATSATAFAGKASQAPVVRDHRHAATPPAANSPPPAAARGPQLTGAEARGANKQWYSRGMWKAGKTTANLHRTGVAGGSSVPTPGKTTQQK